MPDPHLLVVNGDSNTWGSEHDDRERTTWAAVAGVELGIPVVNLAIPGGSNARLVRTTVEFLPAVAARRGVPPERMLFVGMWTFPNRREHWGNGPHRWALSGEQFDDGHWRGVGPWGIEAGYRPAIAWYRDLHQDHASLEEFFCSTVLLEQWLAAHGFRFTLTAAYDFISASDLETYAAYVAQMDDHHYLGGVAGLGPCAFRTLVDHLGDRGPNGHKLAPSHRYYAEQHLVPHLRRQVELAPA